MLNPHICGSDKMKKKKSNKPKENKNLNIFKYW